MTSQLKAFSSEIPRFYDKELEKIRKIGSGGFGEVFLYQYRREGKGQVTSKEVVLKRLLNGGLRDRDILRLQMEANILWKLKFPFIVSLEGLYFSEDSFSIVLEYASNGSCFEFFLDLQLKDVDRLSMWLIKSRVALQVIEAMRFLHGQRPKKVLHLDLKAANVLLDRELNAKVCDFGLSLMQTFTLLSRSRTCFVESEESVAGANQKLGGGGTITHIPPERLLDPNAKPSIKTDVYSFGIFLWEMMTCQSPYMGANANVIIKSVAEGKRPDPHSIPEDAPDFLRCMMLQSYAQEEDARPSFQDLHESCGAEVATMRSLFPQARDNIIFALHKIAPMDSEMIADVELEISSASNDHFSRFDQRAREALARSRTHETQSRWMQLDSINVDVSTRHSDEIITSASSDTSLIHQQTASSVVARRAREALCRSRMGDSRSKWLELGSKQSILSSDVTPDVQPQSSAPISRNMDSGVWSSTASQSFTTPNSDDVTFPKKIRSASNHGNRADCGSLQRDDHVNSFPEIDSSPNEALIRPESRKTGLRCRHKKKCVVLISASFILVAAVAIFVAMYVTSGNSLCFLNRSCDAALSVLPWKPGMPPLCSQTVPGHLNMEARCWRDGLGNVTMTCTWSCLPGFKFEGDEVRIDCVDGEISIRGSGDCFPVKTSKGCRIPLVSNAQVKCNDDVIEDEVTSGSSCTVTCYRGYDVVGPSSIICQADATWSPQGVSQCKKLCQYEPVPVELVQTCSDNFREGSTCTYRCSNGHEVLQQTDNTRQCLSSGSWSNSFPTCKCPGCMGGPNCDEKLTWQSMKTAVDKISKDSKPVSITYGEHKITCESDVDIWFINYDCTCSDASKGQEIICNDFLTRRVACTHALAKLLRTYVASGFYTEPCDIDAAPARCK
ncbi:unnamed protein product [Clavelina lepadiformis]|uniref:Protein kinase domain-containing protein n=2 Tax=Clavelina lepadiformis TaxID=159417 RepID=A0ABP0GR41_CLALP